jgi:sugar phosphate isomerase/epimerase
MYKGLSPGAIGVQAGSLDAAIEAAKTGGFGGVEVNAGEVADLIEKQGAAAVHGKFAAADIRPAGWGLPTDWRGSEQNWRKGLDELPRLAQAAAAIGCTRTMTWIMPCSNDRDFDTNRRFHIERFRPVAAILEEHGCSIGLEFIGPKTLRDSQKYPFIHTMRGMLEMGAEIGSNVGLLLDCWHWYTSHSTVDELNSLRPEQVVYVHVNDAPGGIEIDAQIDNTRALPGETGVIDIAGFLQALQGIGYDGPVTPEPFKKELSDLPSDDARLKTVGAAMDKIFAQAGLQQS